MIANLPQAATVFQAHMSGARLTSRSAPSRTEESGTAPNCSGSGGDGRRTGLRHSPNAD